jgi:fermentation-respiration switch protein FrsA (DUF1100 family)
MKKIILTFILFMGFTHIFSQKYENSDIVGKWRGELDVMGQKLEMFINISLDEFKRLNAELTIPMQMIKRKAFDEAYFDYGELELGVDEYKAKYEAVYRNDSLVGEWKQSLYKNELIFTRTDNIPSLERPQEPQEPFPYQSETVNFYNKEADIDLEGTLTLPGDDKYPAVVLVSGSGPQDRDETLLGHKPFKLLAHELTQAGIAVLRYDDRGTAQSEGDHSKANTADFASDAWAAFQFLQNHKNIDPSKIGIIGHSEGGMIAQMLAAQHPEVAFIVSMAGPGIPIRELMREQTEAVLRAEDYDDAMVEKSVEINMQLYDVIIKYSDSKKLRKKLKKVYENAIDELTEEEKKKLGLSKISVMQNLGTLTSPFFRYFIPFNPEDYLKKIRCPVLAINGTLDVQVIYKSNLDNIEKVLIEGGNENITVKAFEGLNHLFQPAETGAVSEYPKIETTIDPAVLEYLKEWLGREVMK